MFKACESVEFYRDLNQVHRYPIALFLSPTRQPLLTNFGLSRLSQPMPVITNYATEPKGYYGKANLTIL